jgi:PAS domain S-box-containing protein
VLLEIAPDAIVVVDGEGGILAVNERAEALFLLGRDDLLGRPVDDLFSRPWLRLRRTDGSGLELPALRGDGSEFPAEISLAHLDGPGGALTAAAIRDGSERAGREAELREARERFRRVFEDSPVAMALVGVDFRLSEVNDAFCRLTGYSGQELAERTFADITHPGDVDTDLRLARKVFAGEVRSYSIDKRYVRKGGEVVWVALTVSVIRDEAGRPLKGLGIVQDISERRAALDLARAELDRLARDHDRILEFAGEGIYQAAVKGELEGGSVEVSPEAMRMINGLIWNGTFEGRFKDKDFAIGVFNAHNEDVRRKVPADRLLVYEITEGWEPLCEFLDVPVPDTPMPHLNDATSFRAMVGLPALPA